MSSKIISVYDSDRYVRIYNILIYDIFSLCKEIYCKYLAYVSMEAG